jgi:hypothetical protein
MSSYILTTWSNSNNKVYKVKLISKGNHEVMKCSIRKWIVKVDSLKKDDSVHGGYLNIMEDVEISGMKKLFGPMVKSFTHVMIHTPFFTEYILPYIVASLPIIYSFKCLIK